MKRIARDWSPMTQGAEESSPLSRANHCSPAPTQARWTTMARPCQQAPPFSAPRIEGRKLWPLSGLCNPPLASHLDRPNTGGGGTSKASSILQCQCRAFHDDIQGFSEIHLRARLTPVGPGRLDTPQHVGLLWPPSRSDVES